MSSVLQDEARRSRFVRDPRPVQFANIASELNRLAIRAQAGHTADALSRQMTLIASMIEWLGEGATEQAANVQREICRWRRLWPVPGAEPLLEFRARRMSEELLEASGLLRS